MTSALSAGFARRFGDSGTLVRKITLATVAVGFLVAACQGALAYLGARRALEGAISRQLEGMRVTQARHVIARLSEELVRTQQRVREPALAEAVQRLLHYHRTVGPASDLGFPAASPEYQKLHQDLAPAFLSRVGVNVHDVLLVCAEHGHVMFSVVREADLGGNLRQQPLSATGLARVFEKVVRDQQARVEDVSWYPPSGSPAMFLGVPVRDQEQRLIAVNVVQLSLEPLAALGQSAGLGSTGETFLIGEDMLMRTSSRPLDTSAAVSTRVDSVAVRAVLAGQQGTEPGLDYRGVPVLVSYAPLGLRRELGFDFDWGLIVKEDLAEALEPVREIGTLSLLIGVGALMVALGAGVVLARPLTRDLARMAAVADSIAAGHVDTPVETEASGEVGQLADSLRRMQASLRDTGEKNRRAEAELRQGAAYVRSLIEANLDGLFTVGPEGKITDVNRAAEETTGQARDGLLGTEFAAHFTSPERARAGYRQAFQAGAVRDHPLEIRHRDGRVTPVLYSASVYRDESGSVAGIVGAVRDVSEQRAADWLKDGLVRLDAALRGERDPRHLASEVISELCTTLGAPLGLLYGSSDDRGGTLAPLGSYAPDGDSLSRRFAPGEGLVGQAALERRQICLRQAPAGYLRVVSGLGEATPREICVTPLLFEDQLRGVLEIATFAELDAPARDYLAQAARAIAITLDRVQSRAGLATALERSQRQGEELQAQQEELRVSNEELTEKNALLERQTRAVEQARREIAQKADDLALATRYKSEFLANMSHELRTPLNSLLLLARGLAENRAGNLDPEQVESARVIFESGGDLLDLINDILDLSKIEAGRMDLAEGEVALDELAAALRQGFAHLAQAQGLGLRVELSSGLPATIRTDGRRVQQVLRNLVSNALKFTETGSVNVLFERPAPEARPTRAGLDPAQSIAISVTDTGIGIAPDQQRAIFQAFHQVDAGAARRFAGTGLGLSISRELARLLGGEIQLRSVPGEGSTFTVFLPISGPPRAEPAVPAPAVVSPPPAVEGRVLVVGSRDEVRQRLQRRLGGVAVERAEQATAQGRYDCLVLDIGPTDLAAEQALAGIRERNPGLPIVVHAALDLSREQEASLREETFAIVVEGPWSDERLADEVGRALRRGPGAAPAAALQVEVRFQGQRVLVVDDDMRSAFAVARMLADHGLQAEKAENGERALKLLADGPSFDLVLMDVMMPVMDGYEAMRRIRAQPRLARLPILAITAKAMKGDREKCLAAGATDYLQKPIDVARLLSMLRVWLGGPDEASKPRERDGTR